MTIGDADWESALARAREEAPFLARCLDTQPELADLLAKGDGKGAMQFARSAGGGETVPLALRKERAALATTLAIGDLAGAFSLDSVMAELSAFADRALDAAIAEAIRHRVPDADPAGFIALALGKHGACELNYSSDIDPILLFDPDSLPRRSSDEPGEAAQRVARRVVEMLSRVDEHGYVFRVDLRLRPASEVSPLAISRDAALSHYESSALAWERAAFIRARACAGDRADGEAFLQHIAPFVWRKSLDFGAIDDISRLTRRIRQNYSGPSEPGPGFDLKRGRGGIREVEFFAQTQQLIHGGRNPALQLRGTRAALDALAKAGICTTETATALGDAYDRLRVVEHRLQMVRDQQTHSLPADAEALDSVARLDGMPDGAALVTELEGITEIVGAAFDTLIDAETQSPALPARSASALETELQRIGFPESERFARRIEGWSDGRVRALRSEAAREAFEAVLPSLLPALAAAPDPERALNRWETLLTSLPSAINLFRLLEARPGLLDRLVRILSLAPPLADELARRSDLLDPLIDASALDLPGSVEELRVAMQPRQTESEYEEKLDRIRRVVGDKRFALGVQLIERAQDPLAIGAALSRLAEAALQSGKAAAEADFAERHGWIDDGELIVLGLGRLGGGMLTHASDLDVVYLFNGGTDGESDGGRALGPTHYFNRLAQRVSAALSVPTAEGALYEIDTRLRPQGNQGPLAVTIDSFARYQRENAWTWEHMALCRARVVAGPAGATGEIEQIIRDVLCRDRDPAKLRGEIMAMRSEMAQHKPPSGPLDVKLQRGGLVDLEFCIHYLQLREGRAFDPDLGAAIAALGSLLPESIADAYALLTRTLIAARLLAPGGGTSAASAQEALAHAAGHDSYHSLLQSLRDARQAVAGAWTDIFGTTLEIDNE